MWNSLRMLFWMALLTGVAYPLLITLIAQLTSHDDANGGFVTSKEKLIGAQLIGQKFQSDRYFWGRPSSSNYNALASGGSDLAPTSAALKKAVDERRKAFNGVDEIPSQLLYASGSGLDPHIGPKAAYYQVDRIAKARGVEREKVVKLIDRMTEKRFCGFIGEPCVNVLKLNLALDEGR